MSGESRRRRLGGEVARRVSAALARVAAIPPVAVGLRTFVRYNEAGGGLVARGLAFAILFALVPALLLVTSLLGVVVSDSATRDRIAAGLAAQFPPLASVLQDALDAALRAAPTVSIVSFAVLVWSASGMVRSLDLAISLVFREQAVPRSPLRLVVLVVAAGGAAVLVAFVLAAATVSGPLGDLVGFGVGARSSPVIVLAATIFAAYRFLPLSPPGWRAALLPAVAAALAISALTGIFAVIGPLVFSSAQFYGAVGVVFLGIVWLGFATDCFLLGAAWVAIRVEAGR